MHDFSTTSWVAPLDSIALSAAHAACFRGRFGSIDQVVAGELWALVASKWWLGGGKQVKENGEGRATRREGLRGVRERGDEPRDPFRPRRDGARGGGAPARGAAREEPAGGALHPDVLRPAVRPRDDRGGRARVHGALQVVVRGGQLHEEVRCELLGSPWVEEGVRNQRESVTKRCEAGESCCVALSLWK